MWTTATPTSDIPTLDMGVLKCRGALYELLPLPCLRGSNCRYSKARHFGGFFYSQNLFTISTKGVLL